MALRLIDDDDVSPEETSKITKCCRNCRHFFASFYECDDEDMESDVGECRRYPPEVDIDTGYAYPIVTRTLYCGEFDF